MAKMREMKKTEYEELFKKNYSRLFYCALDFVNDVETAKDIVGDVACETWRRIGQLSVSDNDLNVTAYMLNSVRNRAINYLRHKAVEDEYVRRALEVREVAAAEPYSVHEERLQRLWTIMESFTPQTKAVFEQCWFEGNTYQQTADKMGISISAVHKHISKAFAAFRKAFGVKISSTEVTILIVSLLII